MKHIKNFFYNINDLILAALILTAAAILIYWRLDIILDYPEKVLESRNNDTVIEEIQLPEEEEEEPVEEETQGRAGGGSHKGAYHSCRFNVC